MRQARIFWLPAENEGESRPGFQKGSAGARLAQFFFPAQNLNSWCTDRLPTYSSYVVLVDHSRIADGRYT